MFYFMNVVAPGAKRPGQLRSGEKKMFFSAVYRLSGGAVFIH
jgi:hypothetical protein